MEIVTSWAALMRRARAVGEARQAGDEEALALAGADLVAYEQAVLASDCMVIPN